MKRKKTFLICAIALVLVMVACVALLWQEKRPRGIHLIYLGLDTKPGQPTARFLLTNQTDRPALVYLDAIDIRTNGAWIRQFSSSVMPRELRAHESRQLDVPAPPGAKRWRARIMAAEEKNGASALMPRLKWFLGQARNGFRSGFQFPRGPIYDGDDLVSQEIGE